MQVFKRCVDLKRQCHSFFTTCRYMHDVILMFWALQLVLSFEITPRTNVRPNNFFNLVCKVQAIFNVKRPDRRYHFTCTRIILIHSLILNWAYEHVKRKQCSYVRFGKLLLQYSSSEKIMVLQIKKYWFEAKMSIRCLSFITKQLSIY